MPFADYESHTDCVNRNKDKKNPHAYCADIEKKATGKYPAEHKAKLRKKLGKFWAEHNLPERGTGLENGNADQRKTGKPRTDKERKARHKAILGKLWAEHKAQHTGIAQLPESATKNLDQNLYHYKRKNHGKLPEKETARHSKPEMDEYAEIEASVLKEGNWHTDGKLYEYTNEEIKKGTPTFKGKKYYLNHTDMHGTEYGKIFDTYTGTKDGKEWMLAKIRVPESTFTQKYLERVESGLIKNISSTHTFVVKDGAATNIEGKGISSVDEPEIDGAEIISIKRHIKSAKFKKNRIAKFWKELRKGEKK